jgi:hypothetical protein
MRGKVNLGLRGSIAMRNQLKRMANRLHTTIQQLLEAAVKRYLAEEDAPHPGMVLVLPEILPPDAMAALRIAAKIFAAEGKNRDAQNVLMAQIVMTWRHVSGAPQETETERLFAEISRKLDRIIEPKLGPPPPRQAVDGEEVEPL